MYIPLRYKTATAARIAADLWYRSRGDRGTKRRATFAAYATEPTLPLSFCGVDGDPRGLALPEEETARIVAAATEAQRGRLPVPGLGLVECGEPVDWHRDPVTGHRFPAGILDTNRSSAIDWRFCDEINLHRHFYPLAQAHYLSGDARFADAALHQLASWLQVNPPILDRFWHSPLQCAIRAVAWVWLLYLLRGRGTLTGEQTGLIVDAIHEHARFIERHSRVVPQSYNHVIGEWAGLAVIGLALPFLPEAKRWRDKGLEILARETGRQFSREGGHREQSLGYHVFVLEAYTHVVLLCRRRHLQIDPRITRTLERMYEFVMRLMRPDGMLPNMGDEGLRWHALSAVGLRDARRVLSTGAVLFERPDMKSVAGGFSHDSAWLLGAAGRRQFNALAGRPPEPTSSYLADAGLLVLRSGWGAADRYLVFDVGAHGIGAAGHGHADSLSVEVHADGAPLLIDSGTYTYHMNGGWRQYFRGTSAHNTARVDGQDQVQAGPEPFSWQGSLSPRLRSCHIGARLGFADAAHDGYRRLSQPVTHRRLVFWLDQQYWLVWDVLTGEGVHRCETFWHFPDVAVGLDDAGYICTVGEGRSGLRIVPHITAGLRAKVDRGAALSPQGWVSFGYGHKGAAPTLTFEQSEALPVQFITALAPLRLDVDVPVLVSRLDVRLGGNPLATAEAGCAGVTFGDGSVDYLLWSDRSGQKTAGDVETDAAVAWVRVRQDAPPVGACVGGTALYWRGQALSETANVARLGAVA
jgi:hypothetical protein